MLAACFALAVLAVSVVAVPALGSEITVMSGAAVEPGLRAAVEAFRQHTGTGVKLVFATAPETRQRIGAGERPDVVIASPAVLDELTQAGKLAGGARVPLGRVGVGVVMRANAPVPDVSTTDALKRAVLEAETVIYNRASSGLFVEGLLRRLGLAEQIRAKTKRYAGTDMIEPIIHGNGREIGFMPIAEILHFRDRGLQLVGPLPADIQHTTSYLAEPLSTSDAAQAFVRFLATPEAKSLFVAAGIE